MLSTYFKCEMLYHLPIFLRQMGEAEVGMRIECDGARGTIRYIGEVSGTQGEWYGVDWDDPKRGRHDGSHNGVKYFTTR